MQIITSTEQMQAQALRWRAEGKRIGFVPTMGFLHQGHASLMDIARPRCDVLVVSIFVNPTQFAPNEDLDRYPRDLAGDQWVCEEHGVDCVFAPTDGFYPPGHSTIVRVEGLSEGLCAGDRPTHFQGVSSVVARLFGVVQPSVAVFGEKDYQQLAILRRMVLDLAMPVEVVGGPLVREVDGLAMSSRNVNLSSEQRRRALSLSAALRGIAAAAAKGESDCAALIAQAQAAVDCDKLEYLEIRDAHSLAPLQTLDRPARAFIAARYGGTRLIDNLSVRD